MYQVANSDQPEPIITAIVRKIVVIGPSESVSQFSAILVEEFSLSTPWPFPLLIHILILFFPPLYKDITWRGRWQIHVDEVTRFCLLCTTSTNTTNLFILAYLNHRFFEPTSLSSSESWCARYVIAFNENPQLRIAAWTGC